MTLILPKKKGSIKKKLKLTIKKEKLEGYGLSNLGYGCVVTSG